MHTKVTILKIFEGVGQDFTMQVVHMYMSLTTCMLNFRPFMLETHMCICIFVI